MSAKSLHPDEKVKSGTFGGSVTKTGLALAAIFGVISVVLGGGAGDGWRRFFHAYVIGWSFAMSLSIGALFFVILHHLVRARWSTVVRRIAEAMTGAFPILFVAGLGFIIPLVAGYKGLYYWSSVDAHNHEFNHHLIGKLGWLDPSFFGARYVLYCLAYIGMARFFANKSRQQDETGDPAISETLRIAAGPAAFAYAIITIFFSFDILMSLAPKWYSTIFPINFFGGAMIATFAFLILFTMVVQHSGRLTRSVTTEHYHDMGKWLFAWTFFWAYTAFSQFMLIWYANMPEETIFYKYRMFTDWQPITIALMIGHWAFPFFLLLSRWTKRIGPSLAFFAVWQLVFHFIDLYWNVMPNYNWSSVFHGGVKFFEGPLAGNLGGHPVGASPVDVTLWIALFGVFLAGLGKSLHGNIIPVKDPTLKHSLAFENY
jgi:hypothetical protein